MDNGFMDLTNDILFTDEILSDEELTAHKYGTMPPRPIHLNIEPLGYTDKIYAGCVKVRKYMLLAECANGIFRFPFYEHIPENATKPARAVLYLAQSGEDITARMTADGYTVFRICSGDVCSPDGSFSDTNERILCPSRKFKNTPGKIAIWAWALMRVIDYLSIRSDLDGDNLTVIGQGYLNESAALAFARDKRIKYVMKDSDITGLYENCMTDAESTAHIGAKQRYLYAPGFFKNG